MHTFGSEFDNQKRGKRRLSSNVHVVRKSGMNFSIIRDFQTGVEIKGVRLVYVLVG